MAAFVYSDITESGINLKAKGEAGKEIRFTAISIGDGFLPEGQDIHTMTALVNEIMRLEVTGITLIGNGEVEVRAPFTNAELQVGFSYRELGLWAKDPDTGEDRLYACANAGDKAEWIEASGGITVVEKIIRVITITGRAANVVAQLNSGIYITSADLDAHNLNPESHPDLREELSNKANIGRINEYALECAEGCIPYVHSEAGAGLNTYSIDPFGRVNVNLAVLAADEAVGLPHGMVLAVLPEGFCPTKTCAFPAIFANSNVRYACNVDIHPNGRILMSVDSKVSEGKLALSCIAFCGFVTKQ